MGQSCNKESDVPGSGDLVARDSSTGGGGHARPERLHISREELREISMDDLFDLHSVISLCILERNKGELEERGRRLRSELEQKTAELKRTRLERAEKQESLDVMLKCLVEMQRNKEDTTSIETNICAIERTISKQKEMLETLKHEEEISKHMIHQNKELIRRPRPISRSRLPRKHDIIPVFVVSTIQDRINEIADKEKEFEKFRQKLDIKNAKQFEKCATEWYEDKIIMEDKQTELDTHIEMLKSELSDRDGEIHFLRRQFEDSQKMKERVNLLEQLRNDLQDAESTQASSIRSDIYTNTSVKSGRYETYSRRLSIGFPKKLIFPSTHADLE